MRIFVWCNGLSRSQMKCHFPFCKQHSYRTNSRYHYNFSKHYIDPTTIKRISCWWKDENPNRKREPWCHRIWKRLPNSIGYPPLKESSKPIFSEAHDWTFHNLWSPKTSSNLDLQIMDHTTQFILIWLIEWKDEKYLLKNFDFSLS